MTATIKINEKEMLKESQLTNGNPMIDLVRLNEELMMA